MDLKDYRDRLDQIDAEIIALFKERMEAVSLIAQYKKANNLPILAAGREQEVLEKVRTLSGEELAPYGAELFETLMRLSRDYQKTLLDD